jgi:hypothetical protein
VKELRDHEALLVRDVDAGIGNARKEPAVIRRLFVQDAVAANRLRIDVGEQAVRDVLLGFELAQYGLIVIGDGKDLDPMFLKLRERIAQLTELRPTRGSPHRRAIEDHDRLRVAAALVEIDRLAVRVGQDEIGKSLPNLRARWVSIRQTRPAGVAERCRCIETVVVAFNRHQSSPGCGLGVEALGAVVIRGHWGQFDQ